MINTTHAPYALTVHPPPHPNHSLIPAAMRAAQPHGAPHEVFEIPLDPPYILDAGLCLGIAIEVRTCCWGVVGKSVGAIEPLPLLS